MSRISGSGKLRGNVDEITRPSRSSANAPDGSLVNLKPLFLEKNFFKPAISLKCFAYSPALHPNGTSSGSRYTTHPLLNRQKPRDLKCSSPSPAGAARHAG